MNIRYSLYFAFLFFCIGCKHTDNKSNASIQFPDNITLSADSIGMDVVIKPGTIYDVDPFIVVSDVSETRKSHYAVFDKNLKYLYSFCDYGEAPEECLLPTVIKNGKSDTFIVRDHANDSFHCFELTDSCAIPGKVFHVKRSDLNESLWEINHVSGDKYLARCSSPKSSIRRLIDFSSGTVLDSLDQTFDLQKTMGDDYYTEFDDCWIVANGKHFACAYYFIDRIEFGVIDNDHLKINSFVGTDTPPDFYRYTDEELNGKYKYNVDYNPVCYEWLFTDGNDVYASYFGFPWGDIDRHSSVVEKFDFEGNPLLKMTLDVSLASFVVDDSRIIGINPERSDDVFYIYEMRYSTEKAP